VTLVEGDDLGLDVSIPIAVGLSLGDYFEDANGDDTFGFFQSGLVAGFDLGFVPGRLGAWSVSLGGHVLVLGDNTAAANDDGSSELIAMGGLSIEI